ncbi:FecR family protein, partial [Steroidobacter sp.]|uniref:FecR family protein n=1 Tax=Steroidobacter sp. TaxID=1978227 RepID=UPI001A5D222D
LFAADPYATKVGVISSVPLQDGSSMTLNSASTVRVDLNEHERHIDLTRGEVFFDVVKDAKRPFVVTAGAKRIVAVGTRFSIRRDGDEVRVVVTEGRVKVQGVAGDAEDLLLAAGAIANLRTDGVLVQHKSLPQAEEVLSWRMGYLTFRDTPLGQAIREFNQYNRQQMVIDSPDVANIALTGKFKATNFDAFVRLLEDGYQIRAHRAGDAIRLTQGPVAPTEQ